MSTRGRANAIRVALEMRGVENGDPLSSAELESALSNCLSCKACTTECPSNVNLSLLKAELMNARIERDGLSWRQRVFCSLNLLGTIGCAVPSLANTMLDSLLARSILAKTLGIAWQRPLPHFAKQRFDKWFAHHHSSVQRPRARGAFGDYTFVRFHEPRSDSPRRRSWKIAGFQVVWRSGAQMLRRLRFCQGHLKKARYSADIIWSC